MILSKPLERFLKKISMIVYLEKLIFEISKSWLETRRIPWIHLDKICCKFNVYWFSFPRLERARRQTLLYSNYYLICLLTKMKIFHTLGLDFYSVTLSILINCFHQIDIKFILKSWIILNFFSTEQKYPF